MSGPRLPPWRRWASPVKPPRAPTSCPAGSSSVSPSRASWCRTPRWSSPTSPSRRSIRGLRSSWPICSSRSRNDGRSSPPCTTWIWPCSASSASSACAAGGSSSTCRPRRSRRSSSSNCMPARRGGPGEARRPRRRGLRRPGAVRRRRGCASRFRCACARSVRARCLSARPLTSVLAGGRARRRADPRHRGGRHGSLGALPGALALGVSSAGILGRVYADLFEGVPPGPVVALHAAGASRMQVFAAAVWPQAAPSVAAYTLYSFECCVRAAAVLGFVGAGGIGGEINLSMRLFEYGQVLTLLLAFVVVVLLTDTASRRLRGRFQRNAVHGSGLLRGAVEGGVARRTPAVLWLVVAALAFQQAGFLGIAAPGLLGHFGRFARQLFPPDLSSAFLASLVVPLWQTVSISVVGTAIGIALGGALALPATATLLLDRRDVPGPVGRSARLLAYSASRLALALLRSIPELVWVLLCILAVGPGRSGGARALGR